jgi:tetratricopeptide (TPR) repeat protein
MPVYEGNGVPWNTPWPERSASAPPHSAPRIDPSASRSEPRGHRRRSRGWLAFAAFWVIAIVAVHFCPDAADLSTIKETVQSVSARREHKALEERTSVPSGAATQSRRPQPERPAPRKGPEAAMAEETSPSTKRRDSTRPSARPTVEKLMEQVKAAAKSGDWPVAAQKAGWLVQMRGTTEDRRLFGFLLINAGAYKKAIVELERLVAAGKADAEVFHRLGHAYSTQRFHEKAFDAFRTAIRLEPRNPRHYRCGATLILKAYERGSDRFRDKLLLAKRWCEEARHLGTPRHELAMLQRDLEIYLKRP